jgi:hypothetical protein
MKGAPKLTSVASWGDVVARGMTGARQDMLSTRGRNKKGCRLINPGYASNVFLFSLMRKQKMGRADHADLGRGRALAALS